MAMYYRIQDARVPLPTASVNAWTSSDAATMPGVSAFLDLWTALRDLMSGNDIDGWGVNYAEQIREAGGEPVLSIFAGTWIEDDSGSGVVVDPDHATERRYSPAEILAHSVAVIAAEYPDAAMDASWEALTTTYRVQEWAEELTAALRAGSHDTGAPCASEGETTMSNRTTITNQDPCTVCGMADVVTPAVTTREGTPVCAACAEAFDHEFPPEEP